MGDGEGVVYDSRSPLSLLSVQNESLLLSPSNPATVDKYSQLQAQKSGGQERTRWTEMTMKDESNYSRYCLYAALYKNKLFVAAIYKTV